MIKFPKVVYCYKCKCCWHGQYSDSGAKSGCFGINPLIEINLTVNKSPFHLFWCLLHEMVHFLIRPFPQWLESLIDISIDVTLGKHENELVWDLFNIFNTELIEYGKVENDI
jgi:hypothetical protein